MQHNLKSKLLSLSLLILMIFPMYLTVTLKRKCGTSFKLPMNVTEVKRVEMNTLTHEYELFIIFSTWKKVLFALQTTWKLLGKPFINEDLANKVLRCLNQIWQPKIIVIPKSKRLVFYGFGHFILKISETRNRIKKASLE